MKSPNDRTGRIEILKSNIKEDQPCNLENLKAEASLGMGVSEEKIQEYLDQLEKAGEITIEEGKVKYNESN